MSGNKKQEIPLWARTGHTRPTTRREFLAAGILPFSASIIAPQWLSLLLPSTAHAANCPAPSSDLVPFITLNLAGGAGLAGNFVAHDEGGQMLPSYNLVGLGKTPPIEREFGNVPFAGKNGEVLISKFLQGMRETGPNGIAKTSFVAVCVRSRDDSSENKFSADGMIAKAGLVGSLLPNIGRRGNSLTGMGQMPAVMAPPSPLVVSSFNTLTSSLGYAGALGNTMKPAQKEALAKMVNRLSEAQTRKLAGMQSGTEVKTLIDCAGTKNEHLLKLGTSAVDPRQDAQVGAQLNTIWGINTGTAANNQDLIFGSMAYNALKGHCGSVALEIGGYDYHDNSRTTGDNRDLQAGRTVGRLLETANAMNKPLFLYVTSDGSTSSVRSDEQGAAWNSDRGSAGLAFMLYFDPSGRKETKNFQLGSFTQGQAADEKFITGSSPEAAAIAVFANYLVLNKRLDLFGSIAGRAFDLNQLEKVLMFS